MIHAANPPDTLFAIGAMFKVLGKRYRLSTSMTSLPETYSSAFWPALAL